MLQLGKGSYSMHVMQAGLLYRFIVLEPTSNPNSDPSLSNKWNVLNDDDNIQKEISDTVKIKSGRYYHVEDHFFFSFFWEYLRHKCPHLNNFIVPFGKTCTEYLPQEEMLFWTPIV